MANENGPSIHARKAWEAAVALEALETVPTRPEEVAYVTEAGTRREVPHPGAEPLSAFQGPARTSATGLMEHVEEGIAGPTPLSTIDTNAPGQGRTVAPSRPRTIWAGEPVAVNERPDAYEVSRRHRAVDSGRLPDRRPERATSRFPRYTRARASFRISSSRTSRHVRQSASVDTERRFNPSMGATSIRISTRNSSMPRPTSSSDSWSDRLSTMPSCTSPV